MTAVGHLGGLAPLATLPAWLVAAADPAQVADAAGRHLPELTGGQDGTVVGCKVERLRLRRRLGGALPADRRRRRRRRQGRSVRLAGILRPPGQAGAAANLPELGLELHPEPEDPGLPELPLLTDPERARPYLEALLREGSPRLAGLRLAAGRRCCATRQATAARSATCSNTGRAGRARTGRSWSSPRPTPRTPAQAPGRACVPCGRPACRRGAGRPGRAARLRPGAPGAGAGAGPWGPHLKQLVRSVLADGSLAALAGLGETLERTAAGLAAMHRSGVSDGARWAG